jgi:homoserine kinase
MTPSPAGRSARVRVPASSANLGPGFDVLAAALGLHLELVVRETGAFAIDTELDVEQGRDNLVVRAFERLHPADGFTFTVRSQIPLSGGLGSSAAAIVAGLLAADALFGFEADILGLASELEGHPDNVGAALRGGFVICDGREVHRIDVPAGLQAVLVVPHESLRTSRARAALPAAIPLADVTANLAAIATLTLGLAAADPALIAAGLLDRVHQPYRGHLFPRSTALLERAPALGALGATISGAGPTVLLWVTEGAVGAVTERACELAAGWADVIPVPFASGGASVQTVSRSSASGPVGA